MSADKRRDRRVTIALVFFWSTAALAWVLWWLLPRQFESLHQAIEPVDPIVGLIYLAIVTYVTYACVRHVNSDRYKGARPIVVSLVLFVGHIVSTTLYHFIVVLRQRKANGRF